MNNEELFQKLMPEMGTKLSARVVKQDENIKSIQMSQMSLNKQVVQVANSLNLLPKVGCLVYWAQPKVNACGKY